MKSIHKKLMMTFKLGETVLAMNMNLQVVFQEKAVKIDWKKHFRNGRVSFRNTNPHHQ